MMSNISYEFERRTGNVANVKGGPSFLDPSDVPVVAVRELALALKILNGRNLEVPGEALPDEVMRNVETAFWSTSNRNSVRKSAVLLRLRCFLVVARTRRIAAILDREGTAGVLAVLEAAATVRLNASWGFNPVKIARAVNEGLAFAASERSSSQALAA
jgi:hypothetical protein